MTVSVVLRLREEELSGGHLVGQAEVVETGRRTTVRSADELVAFLGELPDERSVTTRAKEDLDDR